MKKSSSPYFKYVYIIFLNYAINIINVFSISIDLNYINSNSNTNIKTFKQNYDDVSYDSMEYISNTYYFNKSSKMFDYNSSNPTDFISSNLQYCTETLGKCIVLSIMMGLLIICTIIGNSFVIAAVILERNLHSVANYLIVSLASADLTVAIMVMPIGAYQEVSKVWLLGKILCDIWTSFDVLCCTASILHLVAIALDRYWAISNVDYAAKRTPKRILTMIIIIWSIALITGVSPHVFGLSFNDDHSGKCHLTDNFTYQLFSTLAAFYLPLVVMCIIYWKIFQSAKFRIRKKGFNGPRAKSNKKKNSNGDVKQVNSLNNGTKTTFLSGQDSLNKKQENIPNDSSLESIKLNKLNTTEKYTTHKATTTTTTTQSTSFTNNTKLDENKPQLNSTSALKSNLYLDLTEKYTTSQQQQDEKQKLLSNTFVNNSDLIAASHQPGADDLNRIVEKSNSLDTLSLELDDTLCMYNDTRIVERLDLKSGIPFAFSEYEIKSSSSSSCDSLNAKQDLPNKASNSIEINNNNEHKENLNSVSKQASIESETKPKEIANKTDTNATKSTDKLVAQGTMTVAVSCTQVNRPNINNILKNRAKIDIKRERKAAKTLGVIMSCFILCWLPFFLMQIFFSICKDCYVTRVLENSPLVTILTWCGYLNSLLNPVIYTIFSPDFRNAFAKILFGKYTIKNRNFYK